jgi:hypothetical protein
LGIQTFNAILRWEIKNPPHFEGDIGIVVIDRGWCSPIIVIFDKPVGREGIEACQPV